MYKPIFKLKEKNNNLKVNQLLWKPTYKLTALILIMNRIKTAIKAWKLFIISEKLNIKNQVK
jgi:hypothetical protein